MKKETSESVSIEELSANKQKPHRGQESPPDGDTERLDGVIIGLLVGFDKDSSPLVAFPGNPHPEAVPARTTASVTGDDLGGEVALLFENGDPTRPILVGRLRRPRAQKSTEAKGFSAELDGERIVLRADKDIVLRCGQASITLTCAGKVLIRGTYLLSRSSGANRIKGGSVQIN